jgi:hypothetical protein
MCCEKQCGFRTENDTSEGEEIEGKTASPARTW